jgi:A/G-specific adenine glycosylase
MTRLQDIKTALRRWYEAQSRDLPWRKNTDPYPVWISEIMLQQTRVETVRPYFTRFLEKWPTLESLADAEPESLRAAWSGLGYYRRASLMLKAAQILVADYDGTWPKTAAELKKLPGFGAYTAGALASIAFDEPVAAVDGNVMRVIARLEAIEGDVSKGPANARIWGFAEQLAQCEQGSSQEHAPGNHSQALIELGALLCTAKSPKCEICPISKQCKALAQNRVQNIPPPRIRPKRKTIELTALVALTKKGVVLQQRPSPGILADLWCAPLLEGDLAPDSVLDEASRKWNWTLDKAEDAGRLKHVLTHRDLLIRLVRVYGREPVPEFRVTRLSELSQLGLPSVASKILEASLSDEELGDTILPGRKTMRHSSPSNNNTETSRP